MKRIVLGLVGVYLFFGSSIYAQDCKENKYKPASKELIQFIDKHIGLDVFFDLEKIKSKHGVTNRECLIDGYSLYSSDGYYCKDLSSSVIHGSGAVVVHKGIYRLNTKYGGEIDLGMILNGKYYYQDVKKAIDKMIPNFPDNFSNHAFVTNHGDKRFKYKNIYFSMGALIYGDALDKDFPNLKNTFITFNLENDTDEVKQCLYEEQLRLKKEKILKEKGKTLILN